MKPNEIEIKDVEHLSEMVGAYIFGGKHEDNNSRCSYWDVMCDSICSDWFYPDSKSME